MKFERAFVAAGVRGYIVGLILLDGSRFDLAYYRDDLTNVGMRQAYGQACVVVDSINKRGKFTCLRGEVRGKTFIPRNQFVA